MSTTKTKLPIAFRPNGKTVLVKVIDVEEKSASGAIVIVEPDNGSKKTVRAEVVALGTDIGPKAALSTVALAKGPGEWGPEHPKVGDQIMIHRMVGNEILLAGQSFRTVREEDIVGCYE